MPVYIINRQYKFMMGSYSPTRSEIKANDYCIRNNIRIFPVCVQNHKLWKVGINFGPYKKGEKPNLSPDSYGPGEIQKQVYKASVYYYNKYGTNTEN